MNYDTYTIVKNARLAIERAEEITKITKIRLNNNNININNNQIQEENSIWIAIEDINCKLNFIINKLNSIKSI
jgi:uncharacterized protein YpuA (DUF1002 family)